MEILATLQSAARRAIDPGVLLDLLGGAVGVGVTVIPDQFALTKFRSVFGDNGAGKGALTMPELIARYGLYAAEIVAGLAIAEQDGPVGVGGQAFAATALFHAIKATKTQFVGTQPVLGVAF